MRTIQHTGLLILLAICLLPVRGQAQTGPEKPPRPMQVTSLQGLNFGTFAVGGLGGTVSVDVWGGRTTTGDVYTLGSMTYCPAVFLVDVEPGTLIHWIGTPATLTNGSGGTISLKIEDSSNSYIATVFSSGQIRVSIGGTLTLPANTPSGSYQGTFDITFYQE